MALPVNFVMPHSIVIVGSGLNSCVVVGLMLSLELGSVVDPPCGNTQKARNNLPDEGCLDFHVWSF